MEIVCCETGKGCRRNYQKGTWCWVWDRNWIIVKSDHFCSDRGALAVPLWFLRLIFKLQSSELSFAGSADIPGPYRHQRYPCLRLCAKITHHILFIIGIFPDLSYYIIAVIRTAYSLCLPVSLSGKLRPLFLTTFSRLSPHMLDAVFPLAPHGFFRFRELQEIVCLSPFPMKMFRSSDNDTRRSRRPLFRQWEKAQKVHIF